MTIQSKRNPPVDTSKDFTFVKRKDGSYVPVTVNEAVQIVNAAYKGDAERVVALVQKLEEKKVG